MIQQIKYKKVYKGEDYLTKNIKKKGKVKNNRENEKNFRG